MPPASPSQAGVVVDGDVAAMNMQPIETAPKDRPILVWCDHEADPFIGGKTADGRDFLTLYAAHSEGMSHAPTGYHIVEWGGAFDDSSWEYTGASLPDWWFVAGSDFEVAANPVLWAADVNLSEPPQ